MRVTMLSEAEIKEIKDDNITSKILDGDLDYVKNYFKKNPTHITYKLIYDQDLLSFSIYAKQKHIFNWLLANGAKIVANNNGFTLLHHAVTYNNDPYYVKELIKFGLDVNSKTKKTPTPLVSIAEYIIGNEDEKYKEDNIYQAEESQAVFKELIKSGADLKAVNLKGESIFLKLVEHGIEPFVKLMIEADYSLSKEKIGNNNILDICLLNFNDALVNYFLDLGITISFKEDIKRYITNTVDTNTAMKIYNTLSDKEKELITVEEMLSRDNGKKKMFKLLERGIKIFPSFIKNPRVIAIADELLKTDRAVELNILGAEHNIEEFMAQDVKDIFLF